MSETFVYETTPAAAPEATLNAVSDALQPGIESNANKPPSIEDFTKEQLSVLATELDALLSPIFATHSETIVRCERLGGAEMTLSQAVNSLWPHTVKGAMILEGIPLVMAEIHKMLATAESLKVEEKEDEAEKDSQKEEAKKPTGDPKQQEAKIQQAEHKNDSQSQKDSKKDETKQTQEKSNAGKEFEQVVAQPAQPQQPIEQPKPSIKSESDVAPTPAEPLEGLPINGDELVDDERVEGLVDEPAPGFDAGVADVLPESALADSVEASAPEFFEAEAPAEVPVIKAIEIIEPENPVSEAVDLAVVTEQIELPEPNPQPEGLLPRIEPLEPIILAEEEMVILNRFESAVEPESAESLVSTDPENVEALTPGRHVGSAGAELPSETALPDHQMEAGQEGLEAAATSKVDDREVETAADEAPQPGALPLPGGVQAGQEAAGQTIELENKGEPQDSEVDSPDQQEALILNWQNQGELFAAQTMPWRGVEELIVAESKNTGDVLHDVGTHEAVVKPLFGSTDDQKDTAKVYAIGSSVLQLTHKLQAAA